MSSKSIPVKLTVTQENILMPVNSYPKHVRVTIRTSPENIAKITADDISAELNIEAYTKPGEYKVPVTINLDPELLLIEPLEVHVSPDTVPLILGGKSGGTVKVSPLIVGALPAGYETGSVTVTPPVLRVSGPVSMLTQIKELQTEKIDITQHSSSFTTKTKVVKNTSLIDLVDAPDVSVTVEIRPVQSEKSYSSIPVYFAYLPHNLQLAGITPVVSFKVAGSQLELDNLNVDDYTVQADCSSVTQPGDYDLQLSFLLPESVKVTEKSAETVKVSIAQKAKEAGAKH